VSKGIVEVRKEQQPYSYFPLVTESDYRNVQTESFINTVYNGSIHHLVVNFIKDERLTKKELDELKSLLDGYEGKGV
jgi:BlaI family penicillinase repressor